MPIWQHNNSTSWIHNVFSCIHEFYKPRGAIDCGLMQLAAMLSSKTAKMLKLHSSSICLIPLLRISNLGNCERKGLKISHLDFPQVLNNQYDLPMYMYDMPYYQVFLLPELDWSKPLELSDDDQCWNFNSILHNSALSMSHWVGCTSGNGSEVQRTGISCHFVDFHPRGSIILSALRIRPSTRDLYMCK